MADNKKSFIAYCDWIETFEELSDEEAGRLAKHLFKYVNDQNPEPIDKITKMCFIPIKNTLKRDLNKYEDYRKKQSENGKKGGRPKKTKETEKTQPFLEKPKKADSVSVSDSVSEIIDKSITYSKQEFFSDWNRLRKEHLKKPSFINSFGGFDIEQHFNKLKLNYSREEIKKAMVGLFKQKKLPNGNTQMQSSPKHFLTHFEPYHTAYYDKNTALYGKIPETV